MLEYIFVVVNSGWFRNFLYLFDS